MKKFFSFSLVLFVFVFLTACSEKGKSDVVAEVLPFDKVCSYEKWKNVAFEGYLSPSSVDCKGTKTKTSSGKMNECTIKVFPGQQETGRAISVTMDVQDGDLKFNEIVPPPANYKLEDFKIYDNEANLIPVGSRVRVTGSLRNIDACHMDVERLDVVK